MKSLCISKKGGNFAVIMQFTIYKIGYFLSKVYQSSQAFVVNCRGLYLYNRFTYVFTTLTYLEAKKIVAILKEIAKKSDKLLNFANGLVYAMPPTDIIRPDDHRTPCAPPTGRG